MMILNVEVSGAPTQVVQIEAKWSSAIPRRPSS